MQKLLICLLFPFFFASTTSFAETESWLSLGIEYSKLFENIPNNDTPSTKTSMDSVGLNLSGFTFFNNSNFGVYSHLSLLFPQSATSSILGYSISVDLTTYDFSIIDSFTLGIGYRNKINDNTIFYAGAGPQAFLLLGSNEIYSPYFGTIDYIIQVLNFGLGSELGLKLQIDNDFSISLGSLFTYHTFSFTYFNSNLISDPVSNTIKNYSALGVSPYICLTLVSHKGRYKDYRMSKNK